MNRLIMLLAVAATIVGCVTQSRLDNGTSTISTDKQLVVFMSSGAGSQHKPLFAGGDNSTIYISKIPKTMLRDVPLRKATRISNIGRKMYPVWDFSGGRVAYLDFSGREKNEGSVIVVRNVETGREQRYDVGCSGSYITWTADGKVICFRKKKTEVYFLDLETGSKLDSFKTTAVGRIENLACSPDGRYICFMSRENEDQNDADGWILNLVEMKSGKHKKIGYREDSRGHYSRYYWHQDGRKILFVGFDLDKNGNRSNHRWRVYDLEADQTYNLRSSLEEFNQQHIRYWSYSRRVI